MSDVQHDEPALLELKEEIGGEIGAYDPTKKKKKKEARMFEDEEPVPVKEVAPAEGAVDSAFLGLKKKKKKKPVEGESLEEENGDAEDEANGAELEAEDDEPAEGIELRTDRDYKYDELLGRVFNNLRENNPELSAERRRTIMRPPQVLREGTKKTVFVNFMDLCKTFFDLFCACIGGAQRELKSDITTTPADNRPGLRKAEPERSRNENCVLSPSLPS